MKIENGYVILDDFDFYVQGDTLKRFSNGFDKEGFIHGLKTTGGKLKIELTIRYGIGIFEYYVSDEMFNGFDIKWEKNYKKLITTIYFLGKMRLHFIHSFSKKRGVKEIIIGKDVKEITICKEEGNVEKITFEKDCNCISLYGINNQNKLRNIIIPKSIERLNGLNDNNGLQSITFEEGSQCRTISGINRLINLQTITIPKYVTYISNAFEGCGKLSEIIFEDIHSLQSIINSFRRIPIKTFLIGKNVTSIGSASFFNCYNLETVVFEKGSKCDSINGFYQCRSLKEIEIPNSVIDISMISFCDCYSLEKVTFEENSRCEEIHGFNNIPIKKITIPKSVIEIYGLSGTSLEELYFEEGSRCNTIGWISVKKPLRVVVIPKSIHDTYSIESFSSDLLSFSKTDRVIIQKGCKVIEDKIQKKIDGEIKMFRLCNIFYVYSKNNILNKEDIRKIFKSKKVVIFKKFLIQDI